MQLSIVLSSFLIRFAFVTVDVEAFAFRSSSSSASYSIATTSRAIPIHRCNHHLGDLDHDALPGNAGDKEGIVLDTFEAAAPNKTDTAREAAMKFVMACSLALVVFFGGRSSGPKLFQPPPAFAFDTNFGTTVVVAADSSVKDSDIADFSMPSYTEASRAEVNSNLKGDKYLLGEASRNYESKSSSNSSVEKES